MFIDKILSRFKIKTKVLIFVLPFVISISAVGLTGLYASGLLQGRMEISNSVLQSLTGFKNLYSSMEDFLRDATETRRDKLVADVTAQVNVLGATLRQVGEGADGHAELADAASRTTNISDVVNSFWTLHEQEVALRKSLDEAQRALINARFSVDRNSKELQELDADR